MIRLARASSGRLGCCTCCCTPTGCPATPVNLRSASRVGPVNPTGSIAGQVCLLAGRGGDQQLELGVTAGQLVAVDDREARVAT
jgi:hypothetical protein